MFFTRITHFGVDDIERVVEELTKRGVTFEQYDEPGLKTDEKSIATFEGDAKVAYFKDPDGHTLSIAQERCPAGVLTWLYLPSA
jgi:hypothetical protein